MDDKTSDAKFLKGFGGVGLVMTIIFTISVNKSIFGGQMMPSCKCPKASVPQLNIYIIGLNFSLVL
jgi:hypothetical protein